MDKLRGKSRESQDIYLKPMKLQGESQGNLKISYLNSMKMQGRSGKTQGKLKKS